jgi:ABC-type antimicrobial peptide transport system permease subunit
MALGVEQRHVLGMFVRDGFVLAAVGVVVGVGAAAGLSRLLTSMLFNVSPLDVLTYVATSAVLLAAAVLASYLPARRASSLNPVEALRAD